MNGGLGGSIPVAASEVAVSWDNLYYFLFGICLFFFVLVVGAMILFTWRYRASRARPVSSVNHNSRLEIVWTIIPTVLVILIFAWGWVVYQEMHLQNPVNSIEVKVLAKQWNWTFQYDDGKTLVGELVVPVNKPVKLVMTSNIRDVLHSFFVPNLRLKKDVVPGMYTYLWFKADVIGTHQIYCAEYCGTDHSNMLAKLVVVDEEAWQRFQWGQSIERPAPVGIVGDPSVATASPASSGEQKSSAQDLAEMGRQILAAKACNACHSEDGSAKIGPTYKGLFGHEVPLADGTTVVADENYIKESILHPQAKIVKGFEGIVMPPYEGQVTDEEMEAIIAFMKSVR